MNIQEIKEKINRLIKKDEVFTAIMLIMVGLASFGLGRQSNGLEQAFSARNQAAVAETVRPTQTESVSEENVTYVGSVNSDKYHLPWCSGAKRINEANKITFASKEEARVAGYVPAGNCPGI